MKIPLSLRAGDSWEWSDSPSDYPAGTWTLKYALRAFGLTPTDIAASADGTSHKSVVSAGNTAEIQPGEYEWVAYVERTVEGVLERVTLESGFVTVTPCLFAAKSTTDTRTHAQKMLDGIEATLEGRASHADMAMTINGRQIQYLKPDELIRWRNYYRREVKQGKGESFTVGIRFGSG